MQRIRTSIFFLQKAMWRVYNQQEWLFAVITGKDMERNVQKHSAENPKTGFSLRTVLT